MLRSPSVVPPVFFFLLLIAFPCNGFYLPGSYMHLYSPGESISAKVNSLTSMKTGLPFSYYSLPYCQPRGVKKSVEDLGDVLMGDQIEYSPYRFLVNVNESLNLCTTSPLNEHEVKRLKQRIRDLYQVNMILGNQTAMRFTEQNGVKIQWTGFPVGYTPTSGSSEDCIMNHLKFKVFIHEYEGNGVEILSGTLEGGLEVITESKMWGYEIVGFEVVPCSIKRDPEAMSKLRMYGKIDPVSCPVELGRCQLIREQERVSFTYDVEFVKRETR